MINRKGAKSSLGKHKSEVHFGVSLGGFEALGGLTWKSRFRDQTFFSFTSLIYTYYGHKLAFFHILCIVEGYILKFPYFNLTLCCEVITESDICKKW